MQNDSLSQGPRKNQLPSISNPRTNDVGHLAGANELTELHKAVEIGDEHLVEIILGNGADRTIKELKHGNTPLHIAAWKGYSRCLNILCKLPKLKLETQINDVQSKQKVLHSTLLAIRNHGGFTALHLAAQNGHNQSCRELLLAGVDPNVQNNYGDTPLHTTCRYGHAGATRILLSAKCDQNRLNLNGDTSLHIACAMGRRKLTRILLEAKAVRTIRNAQNETAHDIAVRKHLIEITDIFNKVIEKEMKKSTKSPINGVNQSKCANNQIKNNNNNNSNNNSSSNGKKSPICVNDKKKNTIKNNKCNHNDDDDDKQRHLMADNTNKTNANKPDPIVNNENNNLRNWSPYGCHYFPDPRSFPSPKLETLPKEPLGNGEQYYLDLAGNIRKGPVGVGNTCYCGPFFKHIENSINKNKKSIKKYVNRATEKLDGKVQALALKTDDNFEQITKSIVADRMRYHDQRLHLEQWLKRGILARATVAPHHLKLRKNQNNTNLLTRSRSLEILDDNQRKIIELKKISAHTRDTTNTIDDDHRNHHLYHHHHHHQLQQQQELGQSKSVDTLNDSRIINDDTIHIYNNTNNHNNNSSNQETRNASSINSSTIQNTIKQNDNRINNEIHNNNNNNKTETKLTVRKIVGKLEKYLNNQPQSQSNQKNSNQILKKKTKQTSISSSTNTSHGDENHNNSIQLGRGRRPTTTTELTNKNSNPTSPEIAKEYQNEKEFSYDNKEYQHDGSDDYHEDDDGDNDEDDDKDEHYDDDDDDDDDDAYDKDHKKPSTKRNGNNLTFHHGFYQNFSFDQHQPIIHPQSEAGYSSTRNSLKSQHSNQSELLKSSHFKSNTMNRFIQSINYDGNNKIPSNINNNITNVYSLDKQTAFTIPFKNDYQMQRQSYDDARSMNKNHGNSDSQTQKYEIKNGEIKNLKSIIHQSPSGASAAAKNINHNSESSNDDDHDNDLHHSDDDDEYDDEGNVDGVYYKRKSSSLVVPINECQIMSINNNNNNVNYNELYNLTTCPPAIINPPHNISQSYKSAVPRILDTSNLIPKDAYFHDIPTKKNHHLITNSNNINNNNNYNNNNKNNSIATTARNRNPLVFLTETDDIFQNDEINNHLQLKYENQLNNHLLGNTSSISSTSLTPSPAFAFQMIENQMLTKSTNLPLSQPPLTANDPDEQSFNFSNKKLLTNRKFSVLQNDDDDNNNQNNHNSVDKFIAIDQSNRIDLTNSMNITKNSTILTNNQNNQNNNIKNENHYLYVNNYMTNRNNNLKYAINDNVVNSIIADDVATAATIVADNDDDGNDCLDTNIGASSLV